MLTEQQWQARRSGDSSRRPTDVRDAYERDRARLIHSSAFRRLQAKTQVLGISEGDFHRTRLTHSMEVAQFGRGIVEHLAQTAPYESAKAALPSTDLIEAIAFSHDAGHPPFGHGGEIALNYMMRDAGGFEGNGQSLRLLARLESYIPDYGLDLTRRTLLGILKYPAKYSDVRRIKLPMDIERFSTLKASDWKPPKCYMDCESDVVDWLLDPLPDKDRSLFCTLEREPGENTHGKTTYKTFDTSIMEIADDIAYGIHDFEDGIALKLIPREAWDAVGGYLDSKWANTRGLPSIDELGEALFFSRGPAGTRKKAVGALVNAMIASVIAVPRNKFEIPELDFEAVLQQPARTFRDALQELTVKHIINSQPVQSLEYRGRYMIMLVFEALASDPEYLLGGGFLARYKKATREEEGLRSVCDYIAGMTDPYAIRMYERLFVPRQGNVFERL